MIIKKISFGDWQIHKPALLNVGFSPLGLIRYEERSIVNDNNFSGLGGILETFRAVVLKEDFTTQEKCLPKNISRTSQLNDYFIRQYADKKRNEALQRGGYKELNLQIGDLENVEVAINGKKYYLCKQNKAGTKRQVKAVDGDGRAK